MSVRRCIFAAAIAAAALGCARGRTRVREPAPAPEEDTIYERYPTWSAAYADDTYCVSMGRHDIFVQHYAQCAFSRRDVRAWGPVPRDGPPSGGCPTRVRSYGDHVVAEPMSLADAFESLPFQECVPREYAVGARHVIEVEDGFLVAYETPYEGVLFWTSADGTERRSISSARILGFVKSKTGKILALARGKARLGRGGLLRLDRASRGEWSPQLVAVLPVEPSGATMDDHGAMIGFAQGFLFRIDERGHVDNLHYVSRFVGRVASITKDDAGAFYLGLECGVLRIDLSDREEHREEWWSARDGASGKWSDCGS